MRRPPPSMYAQEALKRLLSASVEAETDVVSAFFELGVRLVAE